eukprot:gb/GECH01004484.1/.p1 GENE.gb/GECH01004484.1/~~gb/GECH01004484.1/.p1  ORF type:complete len:1003 (+),score=161.28 gb/GECH01004484.1/:1-3009(+)
MSQNTRDGTGSEDTESSNSPESQEENMEEERATKRKFCALEILSREREYVEYLEATIELFMRPMQELAKQKNNITESDVKGIFGDLETIYNFNSCFLSQLEERLDSYHPDKTMIGDVFTSMAPFFRSYTIYVNNYDNAITTFERVKHIPEIKDLLTQSKDDSRIKNLPLPSLLVMPVQRIPRYQLLLTELIKYTEDDHKDYQQLRDALAQISGVADHLNEAMKIAENFAILSEIQNKFDADKIKIVEPHRYFIRSDTMMLVNMDKNQQEQVMIHLFNDLLLISKKAPLSKLQLKNKISLESAVARDPYEESYRHSTGASSRTRRAPVRSMANSADLRSFKLDHVFEIKHMSVVFTLCPSSEDQKVEWIKDIKASIRMCQRKSQQRRRIARTGSVGIATVAAKLPEEKFTISPEEAIFALMDGSVLLKYTSKGKPHFRKVIVTEDGNKIWWYNPHKKSSTGTGINVKDITDMSTGHTSTVFKRYGKPQWSKQSFSLFYTNGTLDLVCKDNEEYVTWVVGIRALMNKSKEGIKKIKKARDDSAKKSDSKQKNNCKPGKLRKKAGIMQDAFERSGDAFTWGQGARGALGHSNIDDAHEPQVIKDFLYLDVAQMECSNAAAAAVLENGILFTWGSGDSSKLGHGDSTDRLSPSFVRSLEKTRIRQVAVGSEHMIAVDERNCLWAWGGNKSGQLGLGDTKPRCHPTKVTLPHRIQKVYCGLFHSAAVTTEGEVLTWGKGEDGELGNGKSESLNVPKPVHQLKGTPIKCLALGMWHTLALSESGQVFTWGDDSEGQLGTRNGGRQDEPEIVSCLKSESVVTVATGSSHSSCVTENGEVYTWGSNMYGQLGIGTKTSANNPTKVEGILHESVQDIACGFNHCIVLCKSNRVYSWGAGTFGRLGISGEEDQTTPKLIKFLEDKTVRTISAGGAQSGCICAHMWVPDKDVSECMQCRGPFTMTRRRHHCRNCGGVFCASCSGNKLSLLRFGYAKPVRVCDGCNSIMQRFKT